MFFCSNFIKSNLFFIVFFSEEPPRIETKMDNYIQKTKIKIEDENKQSIEQFTKDSEKTTDGDASK